MKNVQDMEQAAYKASGQQERETVMPEQVSVDIRVKRDCNCGTALCGVSGLVNLWSTMFETIVNAVSISSNRTKQTVDRATSPEY